MRRTDREMNEAFALSVLDNCPYMVLGMVSGAGEPYCIPVSAAREEKAIYFHCALEGEKLACLRSHPQVCITAARNVQPVPGKFTTTYESAVARGTAMEITEDTEKVHALRLICLRYTPDDMDQFDSAIQRSLTRTGIWKIQLDSVTGKCKR